MTSKRRFLELLSVCIRNNFFKNGIYVLSDHQNKNNNKFYNQMQVSPWNFESNQTTGFIFSTLHRSNESAHTHI